MIHFARQQARAVIGAQFALVDHGDRDVGEDAGGGQAVAQPDAGVGHRLLDGVGAALPPMGVLSKQKIASFLGAGSGDEAIAGARDGEPLCGGLAYVCEVLFAAGVV